MQEPADFWAQQGLIESNNTSMLTKTADGKIQASFASPEGIQAMQMVADLIKDGAALHVSWDEGCQSFIDGNCAMLYTTIARRASVQKSAQFDVATVKSPTWGSNPRKVPAGGCFLAITAQTDDRRKPHGSLRNTCTAWNPWLHGPSEPVMYRQERTLQTQRTD